MGGAAVKETMIRQGGDIKGNYAVHRSGSGSAAHLARAAAALDTLRPLRTDPRANQYFIFSERSLTYLGHLLGKRLLRFVANSWKMVGR